MVKDSIKGFNVNSLCVENHSGVGSAEIFYQSDGFYALKFNGKIVTDIKKDTLEELGFKQIFLLHQERIFYNFFYYIDRTCFSLLNNNLNIFSDNTQCQKLNSSKENN